MLVAGASLATAFTLPARLPPLASGARCAAVHMLDNDGNTSGRYSFEDPRQILNNFFYPSGKVPKVFKTGGKSGKDTSETSRSSDGELQDMIQDSCIDWGGSKDAAEELLVEVLAELKTMETADWGLMDTRETQPAAGDTKYYSGL